MTTATVKYDTRALAVGRAVLQDTAAETVILFGSRARGDYHKDSDIDLLLVHSRWQDADVRKKALAAWDKAERLYGTRIPVDVVSFTPEEFHHMRRTINSVAAIATEEGITMDGQPAGEEYGNDDGDYSNEWTNDRPTLLSHQVAPAHVARGHRQRPSGHHGRPAGPPDFGARDKGAWSRPADAGTRIITTCST